MLLYVQNMFVQNPFLTINLSTLWAKFISKLKIHVKKRLEERSDNYLIKMDKDRTKKTDKPFKSFTYYVQKMAVKFVSIWCCCNIFFQYFCCRLVVQGPYVFHCVLYFFFLLKISNFIKKLLEKRLISRFLPDVRNIR